MSITRRLFLRHTAAASVGATIATQAIAEPAKPLTPDQRISAAVEEIVAAFREKWAEAPIRISDVDNIDSGMLIVITHVGKDKPGSITHTREGTARMVGGSVHG